MVGLTGRHAAPKYWCVQNVRARLVEAMPRSMAAGAVQVRSLLRVPGATKAPAWKSFWGEEPITCVAIAAVRLSHSGTYFWMDQVVLSRSTGKTGARLARI